MVSYADHIIPPDSPGVRYLQPLQGWKRHWGIPCPTILQRLQRYASIHRGACHTAASTTLCLYPQRCLPYNSFHNAKPQSTGVSCHTTAAATLSPFQTTPSFRSFLPECHPSSTEEGTGSGYQRQPSRIFPRSPAPPSFRLFPLKTDSLLISFPMGML